MPTNRRMGLFEFNINPKGYETNDCVIRAISMFNFMNESRFITKYLNGRNRVSALRRALNSSERKIVLMDMREEYNDIYRKLANRGITNSLMVNDEDNYIPYLIENGFIEKKYTRPHMIRVKDILQDVDYQETECALVNLDGHITVVFDGTAIDSFDVRDYHVDSILIKRTVRR